jgi:hypothetical protein
VGAEVALVEGASVASAVVESVAAEEVGPRSSCSGAIDAAVLACVSTPVDGMGVSATSAQEVRSILIVSNKATNIPIFFNSFFILSFPLALYVHLLVNQLIHRGR